MSGRVQGMIELAGRAAGTAGGSAARAAGTLINRLGAAAPHIERARALARAFSTSFAAASGASAGARHAAPGSPGWGARYAASRPTSLGEGWSPVSRPINTIATTEGAIIRARVQQLVRDFPYFARARDVMVNYAVGRGIRYEPKVLDAQGNLARDINRAIEDAWCRWSDEADLMRKMDIYGIQRLSKAQDVEAGEYLNVLVAARQPGRYLPVGVRCYEPDWLTSDGARGEGGEALYDAGMGIGAPPRARRGILGGVEYDLSTGEILAYHLREPGGRGTPVRVGAQWVIHGYDMLRPGQMRGISPFVTAILVAHSLHEIMGSELDASQMASKWLAIVETPDAFGFQASRGLDGSRIERLENAIIDYLQPGEKINFAGANRPGSNFEPFVKLVLRMVAIVTNTSYELLTSDYSGLAYSNLKSIRNDLIEMYEPITDRQVHQQCKPLQRWFLQYATLTGRLDLPGFAADPARYYRAYWQPSGHRLLDPLRETKAHTEQMRALTKSPQEICAERGRDFEDVLEEISQARGLAQEHGLDLFDLLGMSSTAVKTNPAALGAAEEEDGEGGSDKAARRALKETICRIK